MKSGSPYAFLQTSTEYGFSHVTIKIRNINGDIYWNDPTLVLSNQISDGHDESYAWEFSLQGCAHNGAAKMSEVLSAAKSMQKASNKVDKVVEKNGGAVDFAMYAMRYLRALGVDNVYIQGGPTSNAGIEHWPSMSLKDASMELYQRLQSIETDLLSKHSKTKSYA